MFGFNFEAIRHYARYAVNILGLVVLVLGSTEFAALVPSAEWVAGVLVVLNTLLSLLRRV